MDEREEVTVEALRLYVRGLRERGELEAWSRANGVGLYPKAMRESERWREGTYYQPPLDFLYAVGVERVLVHEDDGRPCAIEELRGSLRILRSHLDTWRSWCGRLRPITMDAADRFVAGETQWPSVGLQKALGVRTKHLRENDQREEK